MDKFEITFASTGTNSRVSTYTSTVAQDYITLDILAQAFKDTLVAAGYTYVTAVTVHKQHGDVTSEY